MLFLCVSLSRSAVSIKVKENAGEEARPKPRGHAARRRPAQKLIMLLKYQDILDIRMRPHVGTGHRRSIPGE